MWSHIWAFTPLSSMRCLFFFYHVLSSMEMCILAAMAFCCLCSFCCTSSREFHSASLSGKQCIFAMLFDPMWRHFQPRYPPLSLFQCVVFLCLHWTHCRINAVASCLRTLLLCKRLLSDFTTESFIFVSSEIILLYMYVRNVFVVVLNYMKINLMKYFCGKQIENTSTCIFVYCSIRQKFFAHDF